MTDWQVWGTQARDSTPPTAAELLAPADRVPVYEGAAPPRPRTAEIEAMVWQRVAAHHPRKFARALRYQQWLERMYQFYYRRP